MSSTATKPPPRPKPSLPSGLRRSQQVVSPRTAELETLRQRGLATLLNRHFTETTKRVAQEKAAVDAAARDLQARKAQTSEFRATGNGELSPIDAMAVRVNQWRSECRRKERETLLLYQRFVHKFGATGHVQVPDSNKYEGFLPQTPSWATQQPSPGTTATSRSSMLPDTPPTRVPAVTQQIEQALDKYIETGAMEMPSLESLGKDHSFQQEFQKTEQEFKNYYRRQLEEKGVDARSSANWVNKLEEHITAAYNNDITDTPLRKMPDIQEEVSDDSKEDDMFVDQPYFVSQDFDDDDRSIVSGLTTINSAETRRILQDCERSVATFLKEEHNAIRRMMLESQEEDQEAESETASNTSTTELGSITKVAADQAEGMVKRMKSILDDFHKEEAHDETESLDSTAAQKSGRRYETSNPDEDWVVYYDHAYQREYYHERNTNRTQWQPPTSKKSLVGSSSSTVSGGGGEDVTSTSTATEEHTNVVLSHEQVMPERSLQYGFRYAQYKRQQKRARRRRIMATFLLMVLSALGGAWYYYEYEYMPRLESEARKLVEQQRESARLRQQEQLLLAQRRAKSELTLVDLFRVRETERLSQLLVQEEERALSLRRPWLCNLPFAYVHPRCGQLASDNPLFDLQTLINALMQ